MSNTSKFQYDLGKGWTLDQYVTKEGREAMIFSRDGMPEIALENESCEKLRAIFKKITQ